MEITLSNSKSAIIPAEIANDRCKVLIDTGASRSFLREDYYRKLHNAKLMPMMRNVRIRSATGRDVQILGKTKAQFKLGVTTYTSEFLVCKNLRRPAVLGIDFLRKNRLGTTWTEEGKFALQKGDDILVESIEVFFEDTYPKLKDVKCMDIQARSIIVITTKADFQVQDQGKIFEVKPTEEFMTNHPNLITLPIIHKTDTENRENVPYLLINLSNDDEHILKGEEIAVMEELMINSDQIQKEGEKQNFKEQLKSDLKGTVKDLRLIQCFVWFLLIFWIVVGHPLTQYKEGQEREKREIQERITKTRLTQKIDNSNPYQSIQPVLPGQQPYSVQFEPLAHIRLSRSTYKVTTFIEFKPYLDSFRKFQEYLETFLTDLADPSKVAAFSHLLSSHLTRQGQDVMSSIITRSKCERPEEEVCADEAVRTVEHPSHQVLSVNECLKQIQVICRSVQQFKAIANATEYIRSTFEQVRREFMSVIDHLETESEEKEPETRKEHNEKVEEELKVAYSKVSQEELEILDDIIKQVGKRFPDLETKVLNRHKRFGVMSWIMGWGVYSNWRQIKAIKKNIRKLYEQNLLQEQQILDLAHYLNLTATRVQLHDKMLYNIQVRLARIDHAIRTIQDIVTFTWVTNNLLLDANVVVNRLITGLIVLRNNVE